MHAASRHETPSLTSLPKDSGVSCFGRSSGRSPIQFFDRTQPCLTSVKLMELAGPLGHFSTLQLVCLTGTYKCKYERGVCEFAEKAFLRLP